MDDVIKKDRTRLIEILKTTITNLIRNDESRNKLDIIEEQPEEYEKMVNFINETGEDNETMYKIIPELESESKEESESEDFFNERLNDEGLCSICKNATSRTHVTNSCSEFNLLREKTRTEVLNITELRNACGS